MDVYENAAVDVRERINELLKDKGLTQNSVAAGDKPAQKRLNSQISHGAGITLDTLLRIVDACPDVSLDWLLRGNGDMYVTTANNIGANNINSRVCPHRFTRPLSLTEKRSYIFRLIYRNKA